MKYSYDDIVWTLKDNGKRDSLYRVFEYDYLTQLYTLISVFDKSIVFTLESYMVEAKCLKRSDFDD